MSCCILNGGANAGIRAAAANIAAHGLVDLGVAWILVFRKQCSRTHELAALAVPTLGNVMLDPSSLQWVAVVFGQAFDGFDVLA